MSKGGGKQWQPTPKQLPRMQCARAIPVAWLGSGSCQNRPSGWILMMMMMMMIYIYIWVSKLVSFCVRLLFPIRAVLLQWQGNVCIRFSFPIYLLGPRYFAWICLNCQIIIVSVKHIMCHLSVCRCKAYFCHETRILVTGVSVRQNV